MTRTCGLTDTGSTSPAEGDANQCVEPGPCAAAWPKEPCKATLGPADEASTLPGMDPVSCVAERVTVPCRAVIGCSAAAAVAEGLVCQWLQLVGALPGCAR